MLVMLNIKLHSTKSKEEPVSFAILNKNRKEEYLNLQNFFSVFNGIIQLCIMQLPDAFKKFLKIDDDKSNFEAHKAKRFPKVKGVLKSYLSDLIKVNHVITHWEHSEIVNSDPIY